MQENRLSLINLQGMLLLWDNTRPYIDQISQEEIMSPHPPYSPGLTPSDYHLFLSYVFRGKTVYKLGLN